MICEILTSDAREQTLSNIGPKRMSFREAVKEMKAWWKDIEKHNYCEYRKFEIHASQWNER